MSTSTNRMSPTTALLRHEWRIFRAEGLTLLVAVILALASGYALFNGHAWTARQAATVAAAQAEENARITRLKADYAAMTAGTLKPTGAFYDPSSALWVGNRHGVTVAALPSAPLAATAIGQSDLHPPYIKVSADNKDTFLFGEEIENPANLLTGAFDLAFVVVFLLPLLVLALAYNLLSGEREDGTLALLLSNPVRLGHVLRAKLAFRGGLVVTLLVLFTALALLVSGADVLSARGLAALAAWAAVVAAYALFWFVLAVLVNLFGKGSAQNALVLIGIWVALTLVVPTLVSVAANVAFPVPARAEMVNNLRSAQTAINKDADAMLARYYQEHPELDPASVAPDSDHSRGVRRLALQAAASARVAAEVSRYDEQLARQQGIVQWLRFLSPAILLQQALNDVAGTGNARQQAFTAQVNAFHAQWQGFFQPRVLKNEPLALADYARFPRFVFSEPGVAARVPAQLLTLAGLLLPSGLLAVWARQRLRRGAGMPV